MCTSSATSQKGHNAGHHPSANKPCLLRQTKAPREPAYSQHCQQATGQRHHPWCQTNGLPFIGAHFLKEWYNWKVNPELEFVRLYIERWSNHLARKTGELPQNKTMSQLLWENFPNNVVSETKYGWHISNTEVSKIPTIICKTTAPLCCVFPNEIPFCNWPAVHVGDWLKTKGRHVQLVEADKWDWSNIMIYDKIFFNRKSFFQTQQADCFYQARWSAERTDTTQTENA